MPDIQCSHQDANESNIRQVCQHLYENTQKQHYRRWFSEPNMNFKLLCPTCSEQVGDGNFAIPLLNVCDKCFWHICSYPNTQVGVIFFEPFYQERPSNLSFTHEFVEFAVPINGNILDMQSVCSLREPVWVALTDEGQLLGLDFSNNSVTKLAELPLSDLELLRRPPNKNVESEEKLYLSPNGQFAAVVNRRGQFGVVVNLVSNAITMHLERENYHVEHCDFPIAFFEHKNRTLLMHGTEWNRVDISDLETSELLTQRASPAYVSGQKPSDHYLEYFHGKLYASPQQDWIANDGWVWHPYGSITVWNLSRWLEDNVWESEDGSSKKELCERIDWDRSMCWLDNQTLAVWGYGDFEDDDLIPAARIFDVLTGQEIRHFFGPIGTFVFDEYLFSFTKETGTSVWDVQTGERLLFDADLRPTVYHHGTKQFLTVLTNQTFLLSRLRQ
ncbi:MAG TPA: hypothetical protein VNG51_23935 [Ktedonobacteraceae bacterium]|nr:hypothetical protein [Ktedonobacteraceae bacterium]